MLSTAHFKFFGNVNYNEVTYIGILLCFFWGAVFLAQRILPFEYSIQSPCRLRLLLYFMLFFIVAVSVFALFRFGPSPVVGVLIGADAGSLLLHGSYREQLPLRAVAPPVAIATAIFTYIAYRKRSVSVIFGIIVACALIFFVSVYETRHVLIWIFFYIIGIEISSIGLNNLLSSAFRNWKLGASLMLLFFIFKLFGEIRSGLDGYLEDAGPVFAEGMGVDEEYWQIGLTLLWVVIYGFSSFARGMENDPFYSLFDFVLPEKLFPGPLQFLVYGSRPSSGLMQDRFSGQMFAVDAWHTYSLNFGVLGAVIFVNFVFITLFILSVVMFQKLKNSGTVPYYLFFILLWLSARIYLFPFGDYLLDFAAGVELLLLLLVARITGFRIWYRVLRA